MSPKFVQQCKRANWHPQIPAHTALLVLLLLSLLLLTAYQFFPAWRQYLNPVFAALLLGMVLGMLLSMTNAFLPGSFHPQKRWVPSMTEPAAIQALAFWQQRALRLGIVLFALNISPSALLSIEPWQLLKLIMLVAMILALAWWIGRSWFKLSPELVLLVSAGLSFCGTSAIFATHAVRFPSQNSRLQPQQAAQAYLTQSLAAVLLMGLLALGIYSVMIQQQWLSSANLAWLIGSTAPEVSQAVAAGSQLADHAPQAIMAKLSRVCLLLPFLGWLSVLQRKKQRGQNRQGNDQQNAVVFPWFILAFVGMLLLQLLVTIPPWLQHIASTLSQGCLVFAMLATGLQTRAQDLRQCSYRLFGFAALVLLLLFGLALLLLQL